MANVFVQCKRKVGNVWRPGACEIRTSKHCVRPKWKERKRGKPKQSVYKMPAKKWWASSLILPLRCKAQSENDGDRLRFPAVNFHFKITIFSLILNKRLHSTVRIRKSQSRQWKYYLLTEYFFYKTFVFLSSILFFTELCIFFIQRDTFVVFMIKFFVPSICWETDKNYTIFFPTHQYLYIGSPLSWHIEKPFFLPLSSHICPLYS